MVAEKKGKKEQKHFDGRVHAKILDFNINLDAQLISKSNFIFGASTLVLIFVLNQLLSTKLIEADFLQKIPLLILLVGTFISSVLSMMVILPKIRIFSKKDRIKQDIFYYKNIMKFYSRKKYSNYLQGLPLNNKLIGEAYANQIYSLATHIIPFKFKMLKISGWTFITSIFLSIVSYGLIFNT